jgi:hypothetical protein
MDDDATRYRWVEGVPRRTVGQKVDLVLGVGRDAPRIVPAELLEIGVRCSRFASLRDHAAEIARQREGLTAEACERSLAQLVDAGLLVREGALGALLTGAQPREAPPPRIGLVGIPTCDRPELSRRCVESFAANAAASGREARFLVTDDSRDPGARDRARAEIAGMAARGVRVAYAGLEEKLAYADALATGAGVDPELVRFGLINDDPRHFGAGANRNVLLLAAAGGLALLVDDDVICRPARAPDGELGREIASDEDPTRFWFPDEGAAVEALVQPEAADYLGLHEELLGRRLGDVFEPSSTSVERVTAPTIERARGGAGRVVMTQGGVVGDSGVGSPAFLLFLGGASRRRLLRSEAVYREAFTSRRLVRATGRYAAADSSFCMGLNLGLDLRSPMPPFMPLERNEDGVFGAAVRATARDGFSGFVPWVVTHAPPGARGHTFEDAFDGLGGNNSNDMLVAALRGAFADARGCDRAGALERLGARLVEWGRLPIGELAEALRPHVWRDRISRLERLEMRLVEYGRKPALWAGHAQRYLDVTRRGLASAGFLEPRDLSGAFGDQAFARFRWMVLRYGELCAAWPALVEAARRLRGEGVDVGRQPTEKERS